MYKIKINKLLELFNEINELSDNTIIEMSIKKSRINFEFQDGSLIYSKIIIGLLKDPLIREDNLYITNWENSIRLTCDTTHLTKPSDIPRKSLFKEFFNLIEELGDHICQCPSLEYVVGENYVKIYIDKPSMGIDDLKNLQKVFGQEFTLELTKQRPYCLFIVNGDTNQLTFTPDEAPIPKNNPNSIASVLASQEEEQPNDIIDSSMVRKIL